MQRKIIAVTLAAASAASAQELRSIEIVGPTAIDEQAEVQYHCIAHFDTGDEDVTDIASWSLVPIVPASIDNGLLSSGDLATDVSVLLEASFDSEDSAATAELEVHIRALDVTQSAKFTPEDGAPFDEFGNQVLLSGDLLFVGAYRGDGPSDDAGAVYVFDVPSGQQIAEWHADDGDPFDYFGSAIGVDGDLAIIGAPRDDDQGDDAGAAYVFEIPSGEQIAKLLPLNGVADARFGTSVAIVGSIALVGAPYPSEQAGRVYVFDVTTGQQLAKIMPAGGAPADSFGYSVALDASRALLGAPGDDVQGLNAGAAYLFDMANPVNPKLITKLLPADVAHGDRFGYSTDVSDTIALVGAAGLFDGAAYLFDPYTGAQTLEIVAPDEPDNYFGRAVAIHGANVVIGAPSDESQGNYTGAAYLYSGSQGTLIRKFVADDAEAFEQFGDDVAADADRIAIGVRYDDVYGENSGSAYLFDLVHGVTCAPDLNGDAMLNVLDFIIFQLSWQAAISSADCNYDATFDILDFACYQQLFQQGCD